MSTLIITLPPNGIDPTARLAYVLSADGLSVSAHDTVGISLLPKSHDEVVAVVPAQLLSWHRVSLPAGSVPRGLGGERATARLRAILEGLLEDDLLDEPAQVHLALQPQASSDAVVWVAACDRAWLTAALNALAEAGQPVRRIVPEFPPQSLANTVVMAGDADQPWVAGMLRSVAQGGQNAEAQADAQTDAGLLVCALNASTLERFMPVAGNAADVEQPQLFAEPAVAALAERLCKRPVTLQQRPERLLLASLSPWNLAQFELLNMARTRQWSGATLFAKSFMHAPQWRAARWVLVLLVMVNLIGLNVFALREQSSLADKRLAVRSVLTETFPRIPVVVDAPLQMAREVAVLRRNSGQASASDLESLLAALSGAAPPTYTLTGIDFEAGQLRAKGTGVVDAAAVTARLKGAGLNASLQGEQWLISAGVQP
jgi:general secretion pathway protein L